MRFFKPLRLSASFKILFFIHRCTFDFISNDIKHRIRKQPTSVALRSGATRELIALRQERLCSVLFRPIHLQIRIENIFEISQLPYIYGVDTGNQSRSN